jgi:hypothetical protein
MGLSKPSNRFPPEIWQVTLRQTIINGIDLVVGAVFLIALGVWMVKLTARYWPAMKKDSESPPGPIFSIIAALILFGGAFTCLINAADFLFNPVYWTILDLVDKLRGR